MSSIVASPFRVSLSSSDAQLRPLGLPTVALGQRASAEKGNAVMNEDAWGLKGANCYPMFKTEAASKKEFENKLGLPDKPFESQNPLISIQSFDGPKAQYTSHPASHGSLWSPSDSFNTSNSCIFPLKVSPEITAGGYRVPRHLERLPATIPEPSGARGHRPPGAKSL